MVIEYSLIACGPTVLCSHQSGDNNYDAVTASILPNIQSRANTKTSYTSNSNVMFHVVVENELIYLCAADAEMGKRRPYAFLHEIKQRFMSSSLALRAQFAGEGELNRDFQPVLAAQMEYYSRGDGTGGDKISTLQSQVEEVKGVMTQNIERVLERGQRLEELMEKTNDLEASSASFKKSARRVQHKMWWKNTRWTIILAVVAVLVIGIIIIIILFSTGVLPPKSAAPTTSTVAPSTTVHKP